MTSTTETVGVCIIQSYIFNVIFSLQHIILFYFIYLFIYLVESYII
jgi:hypothetical protein